jgi:acetyl esterase/lipase
MNTRIVPTDRSAKCLLMFSWIVHLAGSTAAAQLLPTYTDVQFLAPNRSERLDIYTPPEGSPGERYPGIVFIHGGAWVSGGKSGSIEKSVCSDLALEGFVCASIDYKLASTGSPAWPINVRDCKTAVQFLRVHADSYQLDASHIGAIGWSAGGHLSLMLGMTKPEDGLEPAEPYEGITSQVQAVVSMYGITNLETWSYANYSETMLGVTYLDDPGLWAFASPVSHVAIDNAPLLFLHGTADDLVPISQSEELAALLDSQGVANTLHAVDGAYHYFDLQPSQEDLRPLTVGFFNRYLRPHRLADFDLDGDIDQSDFGVFQQCLSGPSVPFDPGCEFADFDQDNDVDQCDFGLFQRCYSGPGNAVDRDCAG